MHELRRFLSAFLLAGCATSHLEADGDVAGDSGGDGSILSDSSDSGTSAIPDAGTDAQIVIGTPCVPTVEDNAQFTGFNAVEISLSRVDSGSATCVLDNFEGLVSCPYGQSADGQAPPGASPCTTPGGQPVEGAVSPQCTDRQASQVVFWSCRCANVDGDAGGDEYCTCPPTTTCTQLVSAAGPAFADFAGAYCVPPSAALPDGGAADVCRTHCNPMSAPCP